MTNPTTAAIGARLHDAVRVPLDSLHADADYLVSRVLSGSLTKDQIVVTIRERIDAAKAALASAVQQPADYAMVPAKKPLPDLMMASYHEAIGWNACIDAMLEGAPKAAPQLVEPVISKGEIHQFRKANCANWYDGHPDHEDGDGPYETRVLATQPQEATPYVVSPTTRAKMEEWLEEGTLIDRVAEVLTQQENEIMRLERLAKEQAAPSQDAEDSARLDWLLLRVSGSEFRRIGVYYSGNAQRADIDAARAQQEKL